MDYIEENINKEIEKQQSDKKQKIIEKYNEIMENIDKKTLLDSLLELPPELNFYIIKNKKATSKVDIDKIKDYSNWYNLFFNKLFNDEVSLSLKDTFNKLLYMKYDYHKEKSHFNQLNKLTDTTVELIEDASYAKKNIKLVKTLTDTVHQAYKKTI